MKYLKFLVPIILISLFIFLRFYNIKDSYFFFNDVGRDMSVLDNWHSTGKPPLLGPQNSVVPFNQSAIYFYYLYIFYLITNGSVYSVFFANAFLYLAVYIIGLIIFKKDPKITNLINISFFLVSIHPQYIIQGRYIWNPSLVTPFIFSALLSFYLLLQKYSKIKLWTFSLSIATAISLSYSVIPLFIAIFLFWLIFNRKHFLKIFLSLLVSFFLVNITTLFFELRHGFLLTKSLLIKPSTPQLATSISQKFDAIARLVIGLPQQNLNKYILILFVLLAFISLLRHFKQNNIVLFSSSLFLITFFSYFVLPVTIQDHYVFPIISTLFLFISNQKTYRMIIFIFIFGLLYLKPNTLNAYFKNAPRTISQMEKCFQEYCKNTPEQINVSAESSFHPYHNALEHRFLLKKAGCNIAILEEGNKANKMALILDSGVFTPGKTKFYELDLFGSYTVGKLTECLPNFNIQDLDSK